MLATPSSQPGVPPSGPGWQHEVKWDGLRVLADVSVEGLRLTNRNEVDVTTAYPELTALVGQLPPDVLLDGEVVALDSAGRPSFSLIASRFHLRDGKALRASQAIGVTYMVFDVLRLDGRPLLSSPLTERRTLLDALPLPAPWHVTEAYEDGPALASATAAQDLEGVVSKRLASVYRPGVRSPDWVKVPHRKELVGVIGGWTPETESDERLGAVWIGHPTDEATFDADPVLYPIARAGSGLSHAQRDALVAVLRTIGRPTCPFSPPPPAAETRRTTWVEPVLCVQVRYLGVTEAGLLRQPVLRALRPDVVPLDAPRASLVTVHG